MNIDLKYHEQQEGWTHEQLDGTQCVCFERPREIGGGFVTVDFKQRIFDAGHGVPHRAATQTVYNGKGWRERIVRDALDYLERMATGRD